MKGLHIEDLPETREIDGPKRWVEDKGEFVQIMYDEAVRHLAFFELKKGFWRGKHYHENKDETLYVISGSIRAVFIRQDTCDREEHLLHKGQRIRVTRGIWHVFYGLEDATVVEYSPEKYNKNDAFRGSYDL